MTITINKNTLLFVLALIVLAILGYFIGTQVMGRPGQATTVQVTATLPALADAAGGVTQPQVEMPTPVPDNAPRIELEDFKQAYDQQADMVILDVRPADQFAAGHVAGAINIPELEVPNRLAELPRDKQIILYCA